MNAPLAPASSTSRDLVESLPALVDRATRFKSARVWARQENDWYVEPPSVTRLLLTVETFDGLTWDPACGQGNVTGELIAAGVPTIGTDIAHRGARRQEHGWRGTRDFLAGPWWPRVSNIVCNPPFGRARTAEAFVRKALSCVPGKVAIFIDIRFAFSGARARGLFAEHPYQRLWLLSDRPSCPPGEYLLAGNKAGGGQADWCWIVWDKQASQAPRQVRELYDPAVAIGRRLHDPDAAAAGRRAADSVGLHDAVGAAAGAPRLIGGCR